MDSPKPPQALQIIATDDPGNEGKFLLREENLKSIIDKIPPGMKVGVVSVVGAFRTGKSFLLNLFLRYLRSNSADDLSQSWMVAEGEELSEGNMNEAWNLVDTASDAGSRTETQSFGWRGGQDRQTTGIWMWSEPILRSTASGEPLAVLLMDTQGMFDNETTMTLTAQIFGLSTLVASFQIYNVDKRIQEDNLQHLALFSEYGRMSLLPKNEKIKQLGDQVLERMKSDRLLATLQQPDSDDDSEETSTKTEDANQSKPFQRLQFLVRDWQNFDDEELPADDTKGKEGLFASPALEKVDGMRGEMQRYLEEVLRTRTQGDLASTREQILRCFDQLDCFMLPHPGFAVTKKNYDGKIEKIDPLFRGMVNYYVRYVFDQQLAAKLINGVFVTGPELLMYIQIYTKMFVSEDGSGFPKAMTVLDATAEGNNRIATERAMEHFKRSMDTHAGAQSSYVKEEELAAHHTTHVTQALRIFDDIATMGMPSSISRFREVLVGQLSEEGKRYAETNSLRNPYKDVEYYLLPLAIALLSMIAAKLVDWTCSHDVCEKVEDTFENVYLFIFFVIIVMAWRNIKGALAYFQSIVVPLVMARVETMQAQQKK